MGCSSSQPAHQNLEGSSSPGDSSSNHNSNGGGGTKSGSKSGSAPRESPQGGTTATAPSSSSSQLPNDITSAKEKLKAPKGNAETLPTLDPKLPQAYDKAKAGKGPIVTPVAFAHNDNPDKKDSFKGWAPPKKERQEGRTKKVGKVTEDITDEWDVDGNLTRTITRTIIDKAESWKWHKEKEVLFIPAEEAAQYRT